MKYNMIKRGVLLLITTLMVFSSVSCGKNQEESVVVIEPMEVEEVYSYSPDAIGGKDVMPIAGFNGPYYLGHSYMGVNVPDYVSDDIFSKLSEAGINLIKQSYLDAKSNPAGAVKQLELAEKYGMGVYVRHGDITGLHRDNMKSTDEMAEIINKYAKYPAFAGMDIIDEPGSEYWWSTLPQGYVSDYVKTTEQLRELGISPGINVIGGAENNADVYHQYIDEICSTLKLDFLCHTNYTFSAHPDLLAEGQADTNLRHSLWKLDFLRDYGEKYQLPVWRYLTGGGQMNDSGAPFDSELYNPTEGQTLWEVNTSLAYGVKGLSWFTLIQPLQFSYAKSEPYDSQRNGLLGVWGNRTQFWYYAKKANEQVAAVDHVLMNSKHKGILVSGEHAAKVTKGFNAIISGKSWRELEDITGSAMVGCFNYQGKTAFYIVNFEYEYKQKINLDFFNSYDLTVIQKTETSRVNTDSLVLDMEPGEGVLVVVD